MGDHFLVSGSVIMVAARSTAAARPGRPAHCRPPGSVRCPGGRGAAAVGLAAAVAVVLSLMPGLCRAAQGQEEDAVSAVTSGNWSVILQGQWMIQFYAPWCPACQQFQSDWENLAKEGPVLNVNIAKVDVTEEPGLSGRFFVTTLPTIYHAQDGVFRRYHGSRMLQDLHAFILQKKWKVIEPVAGWKSPSSILMSGMAGLFNLSGWIRQIHNYFTGPLAIPAWGSYTIFIVATLLIGLILGLILVLLTDCLCPAKPKYEVLRSEIRKEDVGSLDPNDASDEEKSDGEGESDNEDDIDEDDREEHDEDNKGEDHNSGTEDSEEDSETVEEDVQKPSTPEPDSALRQRRGEAADSGH